VACARGAPQAEPAGPTPAQQLEAARAEADGALRETCVEGAARAAAEAGVKVVAGDTKSLGQIKGIGKKTAERFLVEL
jgi:predicted flap endonuclease-1-like 5' DNA nuclease